MQDNKSTILMANNGKFSCTKCTKHIKNRYSMMKDKIGQGEVIIQYCPTNDMRADINNKAVQGSLFYKMQAHLMRIDEDYHDDIKHENTHPTLLPQEAQECMISDETREVLYKAEAILTLMAVTKTSLPEVQRNTQAAIAALLLIKLMARGTQESPSHCRGVLGDKGYTLCTGGKGMYKGPNPSLLVRRITDRQAQIRK
eukprot:12562006-Ditylum_brightwellii.AAC.1